MNKSRFEAIRRCRPQFIQSLNTSTIVDHLISGGHFSHEEWERIAATVTSADKVRLFLDFLIKKSADAFECFHGALSLEQPYLAEALYEQLNNPSIAIGRQSSLPDIHQYLLHGAVPDRPTAYIERHQIISNITARLKWLGSQFSLSIPSNIRKNAWVLIYGPPGQGKSVLTAAALRQNTQLLTDVFSGGVLWLNVGEKKSISEVLSVLIEHVVGLPSQNHMFSTGSEEKSEPYNHSTSDVNSMKAYLRRRLINRQYRRSGIFNEESMASISLLLIVLDDVWDECIVNALDTMPAAFVVTSRDMNILQRASAAVQMECVDPDLTHTDVVQLLAARANMSRDCFSMPGSFCTEVVHLCRGSPFAASLLGGLLLSPSLDLTRYLDPHGLRNTKGEVILDWSKIVSPSCYAYESFEESVSASLARLSEIELERYRQFVIFEDDCPLTEDVFAIYWSCPKQEAEDLLQRLRRFSLVQCKWEMAMNRSVFSVHNLQLDLLRTTTPIRNQQIYHCQFIDNYKANFGEHWARLADFKLIHTYFCRSIGDHMLKAGRLAGLIDIMTNLQFICARLLVLGSSAVVADFRRYRPVFQEAGRITDWHMYLHFLQTTAYQLINPDRVVRELHLRARSPTRPGSLCDMSSAPRRNTVTAEHTQRQSMTPDSFARHGSPSPPTFGGAGRSDVLDRHRGSGRLPRRDLMVKGLDLLQLGLMFPHDNTVFKQSVGILRAGCDESANPRAAAATAAKYYWFWSNSSSAGSELVWATRTGRDRITTIAIEPDYSTLPPSLRRRTEPTDDRSIDRRFVGTSDGRIIILDATSGYEVAIHQVHKPSVAVMAISLLPGGQSCLSCGADGRMIVSTLPPVDACLMSPSRGAGFNRSNTTPLPPPASSSSSAAVAHEETCVTFDVDDDDELEIPLLVGGGDEAFFDISTGGELAQQQQQQQSSMFSYQGCPLLADCAGIDTASGQRSESPVLQEDAFPTYIVAPTVLADLPGSFEIRRNTHESNCRFSRQVTDSEAVPDDEAGSQQCIALSPLGTCILFSDQVNPASPNYFSSSVISSFSDATLKRRSVFDALPSDCVSPPPHQQTPISFTIYSILTQSQSKFTLVKSRELTLPAQLGERPTQVSVVLASISIDDSLIVTALSNGRLWVFSLDEIGWVICIATVVSIMADPFFAAPVSTRTPRPRLDGSPLDLTAAYHDPDLVDAAHNDGKVAKSCIFIHWPRQSQISTNPAGWVPPLNPLVAAAIDNCVLVWAFNNQLPDNVNDLQDPVRLVAASRAQFCLPCSTGVVITTLDSQSFRNRCLLSAGLDNGHAIIWSLPELCKVFDVCAHCASLTCVRISPYEYYSSPLVTPTSPPRHFLHINSSTPPQPPPPLVVEDPQSFALVSVTTAAADGVVKAWNFPWPCHYKEAQSTNMSPIRSGNSSPSRPLENSVRAMTEPREQPFPLWADVYSVTFAPLGEFYVIGRIKASCSLQILYRRPLSTNRSGGDSWQSFHCIELAVALHQRGRSARVPFASLSATPVEQAPPSAFQAVNRIVTTNPVPSCAAFSGDMRLLVVGFENGTVQVLQMNTPKDPLNGFKPYRKFTVLSRNGASGNDLNTSQSRPGVLNRDLTFDIVPASMKVTHLAIWSPSLPPASEDENADLELVIAAITAGGTVCVWEVNRSKTVSFKRWPRMHLPTSSFMSPTATITHRPPSPPHPSLCRPFSPDPWSPIDHPVVWFCCRANLQPLQGGSTWQSRLAWLSAGRDGVLNGRSISDDWSLTLVAHKHGEITDVDVDPHGKWIATASADCTVRVWCLLKQRMVFEGSHKPSAVRCVKFRPVTRATDMGSEMLLASGDAEGNLRVWRLMAPKCGDHQLQAVPPTISSNAAGCGGSGFLCLAWSADGNTLAGLSDRLCGWRIIEKCGTSNASQIQLDRSRVIRVFDTVAPRNRLFLSPGSVNLPPTVIVLEAQSGTCFVFDPIEMLNLGGGGACSGGENLLRCCIVQSDVTFTGKIDGYKLAAIVPSRLN